MRTLRLALLIGVCAAAPYLAQGGLGEIVDLDDPTVLTENRHVLAGLTAGGLRWAFTTFHAGNWHPLTWVSHQLAVALCGPDPWWQHQVNVLLHGAGAALLFLALARLTGAVLPSLLAAALFAMHPLRVESVAWISERKDVLSGLLFALLLLAYERYARRGGTARYALVVLASAAGLMAKPMLVTAPFLLLLLDLWPLGRAPWPRRPPPHGAGRSWGGVLAEKLPLLLLSAAAGALTLLAQRETGTVAGLQAFPLGVRVANAVVSWATYLVKILWPSGLAVVYPHPLALPPWPLVAGSLLVLCALAAAVLGLARRQPFAAVGCCWFFGMQVPVIGLVQVGGQALADRYTYLPSVGLAVAAVWGAREAVRAARTPRAAAAAAALALALALAAMSVAQVALWRSSETLFRHALAVTSGNWMAHAGLGGYLLREGRGAEALSQLEAAVRIMPGLGRPHLLLGSALEQHGRPAEAERHLRRALSLQRPTAGARNSLGNALLAQGRVEEAAGEYRSALRLDAGLPEAHANLGRALARLGRREEAAARYEEAIRLRPEYAEAHNNLGVLLAERGQLTEAIRHYREAVRHQPGHAEARFNLGVDLEAAGLLDEAAVHLQEAVRLRPRDARRHRQLAAVLRRLGRTAEADAHAREALRLGP